MNAFMQRIMPSRIGKQIAVLVVTAIVVAHVAITTVIFFGHSHAPEPPFLEIESLVTTQRLIAAEPDETLRAVANRMADRHVSRLPVVDRDDPTRIRGLVTLVDLLAGRRKDIHEERHAERIFRVRLRPAQWTAEPAKLP